MKSATLLAFTRSVLVIVEELGVKWFDAAVPRGEHVDRSIAAVAALSEYVANCRWAGRPLNEVGARREAQTRHGMIKARRGNYSCTELKQTHITYISLHILFICTYVHKRPPLEQREHNDGGTEQLSDDQRELRLREEQHARQVARVLVLVLVHELLQVERVLHQITLRTRAAHVRDEQQEVERCEREPHDERPDEDGARE